MNNLVGKTKENELLKGLAESQTVMNYAFAGFKTETEKKFNDINERLDEHDTYFKRRIYITTSRANTLQQKVKEKVKKVCEENSIDYHKYKSKIFPRIWGTIKNKYSVANYRELPDIFWEDILDYIKVMAIDVRDLIREEQENVLCKN